LKVLKKLDAILETINTYVCAVLFAAIIIIGVIAVFFRYVLNNPLMWSEEIMRFAQIYLIMLGSALTVRIDGHTSIDFVPTFFLAKSPIGKMIHFIVTRLICVAGLIMFLPCSIELMDKMGGTLSAALRIPMRYIYLAFPIGAVLMLLAFIKMIPEKAKAIKEGRDE